MIYEFEILGDIKGKARPRVNTYSGKAYTPTLTKDYEMLVKQYFKVKYPRYVPIENDRIAVTIIAYFKIAKSKSKKEIELIDQEILSPVKKPDIDNIIKIVLDALNKMAFKDDSQITKLNVEKKYLKSTDKAEEKIHIKIETY